MKVRRMAAAFGSCIALASVCLSQASTSTSQDVPGMVSTSERSNREVAYVNLFEAQRLLNAAERRPDRSDIDPNTELARQALLRSIKADPSIAEAYTLLGEITISTPPFDIAEGITLARKSIAANPQNFGGRRLLARLVTIKAGIKSSKVSGAAAASAISEWRALTDLDPRNAEAWAFLAELYDLTGQTNEGIDALRKWSVSAPPIESQFYRNVMGQAADLAPETASLKLGSSLLNAGRADEAAALLSNVIADDPQNDEAAALLRDAVALSNGAVSETVAKSVRQALNSSPQSIGLIRLLADIYIGTNHFADAEKMLRDSAASSAKTDPALSSAIVAVLGDTYAGEMRLEEAVGAYERALNVRGAPERDKFDAGERIQLQDVISKLINSYRILNRNDAVLRLIERSRRMFGADDVFADRQLVEYLRSTGNAQGALKALRDVRLRKPADQSLARLEASVLAEQGDVDKAIEVVRTASAKASEHVGSADSRITPTAFDDFSNLLFYASLYTDAGHGPEARNASEKAVRLAAGDDDRTQIAQLALAEAMRTEGDFAGAESMLRALVKMTPGNPIALNNLGYFLTQRGEHLDEAVSLIRAALKVEPANPSYLDSLGWALFGSGKYPEAEAYLRLAARINSGSAAIQEHLGDVQAKMGKADEARASWERALIVVRGKANTQRLREKLGLGAN
ncbi:MAG: tetratricopeptide repeat protein [Acidobacteriota bacterium]